ncbi:beta-1,3-galactosyl-O-glycosyl-glycoprotein beta-1,6-N-acetylglucosaminyltransferase isoform X3 [Bubalus bubalis]|uniref:beta-1,3-galactosyl-O-glycosyl-glycoprotein beta-1,6-N-acetylglucosaminyltransferase isoform X3 n=1 Tax=Bubalus bubalis TaxID=89462 RepID=UPI001D118465|nr:beta-1,3-galactosyl-O-glycosyl-glycoprotein beta-1,6-N-acetylglucosaminyltransferase isoform X3 [Bubalus bubalis]
MPRGRADLGQKAQAAEVCEAGMRWAGPRGAGPGAWRTGARVGGPRPGRAVLRRQEFSQPSAEQRRAGASPCCPAASSVFRARHSLQLCSWIPSKTQAPQPATHFSSFSVDDRSPVHPGWALRAARLEVLLFIKMEERV